VSRNEREHIWCDEMGTPILKHVKYLTPGGQKRFPWYTRYEFAETGIVRWFKGKDPSVVAPLLYPMPVFAQADRVQHILIVEGEADQEAAHAAGLLAVTAGAAGAFGREHALLFKGWCGRITIVRDNDLPGAWGAVKAYDALREVGIPATRLRVARGRCKHDKADLRDHLDAGYTVEQVIGEGIGPVRALAARATAEVFASAGYGDWVVVGADELEQLRHWKPGRAS
jgi:hypothetical protein